MSPRSSMESSSRTSFSSSSTSFSSLKHRSSQEEQRCSEQTFSSGRSAKNSSRPRNSDIHHFSINEKAKEEVKRNKVLKPIDSPRPNDLSKFKDLEESLRILIKLKEMPRNFHEVGGSPRFSYDGSEGFQTSTDIRHAIKKKEHRRLSLDNMEDSLRCDFNSKFNSLTRELEMKTSHRVSEASNLLQDLVSNGNHPSVVAKLMGLESARKDSVKGYEPVNAQKKQESKHVKLLPSPSNSTKSQRGINQHLKSNSNRRIMVEDTQNKMAIEYAEGNMDQKIESVYSLMEKTLQKLQFQHNNKEIRDLRRAILEIKKKIDWNFRSVKSLSPQCSNSEKASISKRALKSPIAVMKPASAKLEGPSGLRRIRTSDSSNKTNGSSSADGEQTPTGKSANSFLNSSSKETSRRGGDNFVSPRLQKRESDQEKKSCASIPSYDLKKTQKQPGNRQQLESVALRGRITQKPSKAQDNEGKSQSLQQTKGKTPTNAATASKHKQHQMIPRKVLSAEEFEKVAPQLSSPNSVLDASLYQDGLPLSPLSVSSLSNAEDENLPSDHNFKMMHLPHTLQSTLNLETDSQKPEIMDSNDRKFIVPGTTSDEPPLTNEIAVMLDNNDLDYKYVAEVFLSSVLLNKDQGIPSMLNQIKPVEPSEAVEKNNTQMIHKQLVYDVVNEILTRKREAFNSGCQNGKLLFLKELYSEVKCLQSSRDGSLKVKDSVFTKDLVWRSKAWYSFESEVPVIHLEIERLIFADLVNEIVSTVTAVVLETK